MLSGEARATRSNSTSRVGTGRRGLMLSMWDLRRFSYCPVLRCQTPHSHRAQDRAIFAMTPHEVDAVWLSVAQLSDRHSPLESAHPECSQIVLTRGNCPLAAIIGALEPFRVSPTGNINTSRPLAVKRASMSFL